VEIFRQRRREARRGPGVLQARRLIERGDSAGARTLLLQLVEQDPQWQPLRALLAQVDQPAPAAAAPGRRTAQEGGPEAALARFSAFLERIAGQRSLSLPAASAAPAGDLHSQGERLEAFAASLAAAEGRLALSS
jgi:hypothetical protein